MFDRKTANIFNDEPQSEISHVVYIVEDELQPEIAGIVHGEIKTSANLDHATDHFAENKMKAKADAVYPKRKKMRFKIVAYTLTTHSL